MDYFITVDAETDCIPQGVLVLSQMRDEVEQKLGRKVPLVWFVRFQRRTKEDTTVNSLAEMTDPPRELFDGYSLAKDTLLSLQARGDEIGWHYHAYHFTYRPELPREDRLAYLHADLRICARELRRKHPELAVRSFRFGWFFAPDYSVYKTLGKVGIRCDASTRDEPNRKLKRKIQGNEHRFLEPLDGLPRVVDGVCLFSYARTIFTHDYNAIPHDLRWRASSAAEAAAKRQEFQEQMTELVADAVQNGGNVTTYTEVAANVVD